MSWVPAFGVSWPTLWTCCLSGTHCQCPRLYLRYQMRGTVGLWTRPPWICAGSARALLLRGAAHATRPRCAAVSSSVAAWRWHPPQGPLWKCPPWMPTRARGRPAQWALTAPIIRLLILSRWPDLFATGWRRPCPVSPFFPSRGLALHSASKAGSREAAPPESFLPVQA